jgi:hypothetical protein
MRSEDVAAILACDKFGRFGILRYMEFIAGCKILKETTLPKTLMHIVFLEI